MSTDRFFEEMIPAIIKEIHNIVYNDDFSGSVNWDDRISHECVEMLPSKIIDIIKSEGIDASYTINEEEDVIFHINDKNISMTTSCSYFGDDIWFMLSLE